MDISGEQGRGGQCADCCIRARRPCPRRLALQYLIYPGEHGLLRGLSRRGPALARHAADLPRSRTIPLRKASQQRQEGLDISSTRMHKHVYRILRRGTVIMTTRLSVLLLLMASGCGPGAEPDVSFDSYKSATFSIIEPHDQTIIEVKSPKGFDDFCNRHVDYCATLGNARPERINLDEALFAEISAINYRVNRSILPLREAGNNDHWAFATLYGDCEDYCLLKQRDLAEVGIPLGAMPIAAAWSPEVGWHAVLLVQTENGTLVLDNTTDKIEFHPNTPYEFRQMQNPQNMLQWIEISVY